MERLTKNEFEKLLKEDKYYDTIDNLLMLIDEEARKVCPIDYGLPMNNEHYTRIKEKVRTFLNETNSTKLS